MESGSSPGRETARKRWAAWAARTRVAVSALLAVAACLLARPTPASVMVGVPVGLAGLAIRAWASGHLRKNQELAASGPYARVRNPLYLGSLLGAAGLGIAAAHPAVLAAVAVVFIGWFLPVVGEEEAHLRKILPGFADYESRVPRFLPSLRPRYPSGGSFDWRLYLANREQAALLGFAAFVLLLGWRLWRG